MKLINKILVGAGLLATMSVTSCSDLTTSSPSAFDDKNVFSQYELAEFNIFSIYEVFGHTNSHRGRYLPWYGFNTDIEIYLDSGEKKADEKGDIAQYDIKTNNGQLNLANGPYNELMVGVERANLCVDGLRKYGNTETDKRMASLLGEALCARALIYTELLKAHGEVPARFEPITPETIYLPKSDRDVIYKQLLADLEEAFGYMEWPGQSAATMKTDRPSLAFAKGLYARLALMASGYAQRPDEGLVNTGNAGSVRLSSDPELSKEVLYPKAKAALEDVVNNAGLELYSDYVQLWKDLNNFDLEAGKEIIYSLPLGDARGRWNFTFAIRNENYTKWCPSTTSRGGVAGPVPSLFFKYDRIGKDQRRDVSCANFRMENDGTDDLCVVSGAGNWYFGKYRFDWQETLPYGGGNDDGVKPVYMRYADILLMLAEVTNELEGPQAAKPYLLEVRKRAYKGYEAEAEAYVNALASKDAFFNAIVEERALEFVGEFLRKADLIRWNMLKTKLDEAKSDMYALSEKQGAVYYKYNEDGYTLTLFGYNEGELGQNPGAGWIQYTDSKGSPVENYFGDLKAERIERIYRNDPDTRQWWPIFENTITNSQGKLVNDYGF
jgi:hypothetical protein